MQNECTTLVIMANISFFVQIFPSTLLFTAVSLTAEEKRDKYGTLRLEMPSLWICRLWRDGDLALCVCFIDLNKIQAQRRAFEEEKDVLSLDVV